ncbi:MAG: dTDP-4-dehydrorhamnose 3,5-epimerase [Deltaproteobacteria bacterium]|nr:dTDP-4-dehydrorhamnose 3,5-epimerase [Deltaproteobacteria bacterium]
MNIKETELEGVYLIESEIHKDSRGSLFESFRADILGSAISREDISFVQENQVRSKKGVLRGLHYQLEVPQGKLVRVTSGAIFDVAVDLRKTSKNFGKWFGTTLSLRNRKQLWVPEGFAHGYIVLTSYADVVYKATTFHSSGLSRTIVWDDKDISIKWPVTNEPVISLKDKNGVSLKHAEIYE